MGRRALPHLHPLDRRRKAHGPGHLACRSRRRWPLGPAAALAGADQLDRPSNADGSEIDAVAPPTGRTLMFSRDLKGNRSGEFFVWHRRGQEDWLPTCPNR